MRTRRYILEATERMLQPKVYRRRRANAFTGRSSAEVNNPSVSVHPLQMHLPLRILSLEERY